MITTSTFLELAQTAADRADVALLPLPFDGTTSYGKGTAQGPRAVVEASTQIELWDEEVDFDLDSLSFHLAEAIQPLEEETPAEYLERVLAAASALHAGHDGRLVLGIGGEHSLTPPLLRAAANGDVAEVTVVQFDAHSDLRDRYQGTPYSHASCMRRVVEMGAELIAIGVRSADRSEFTYGSASGKVATFFAQQLANDSRREAQLRETLSVLTGDVYLTFDVDCLELPYCPATGTPQPGGLGWWQTLSYLRCLLFENRAVRLIGGDVVETVPQAGTKVNEFTAAKLICKVIAYHFAAADR